VRFIPSGEARVGAADIGDDGRSRQRALSFNDDANVQGRLGLRVGTTTTLWQGITMGPFVIGSLWGNLSNDN